MCVEVPARAWDTADECAGFTGRGEAGRKQTGVITLALERAIANRRTVLRYQADPVPKKMLAGLIGGGVQAPSSFNLQPWCFHVAGGKTRDQVASVVGMCTVHLQDALASMGRKHREAAKRFFVDLGGAPVLIMLSVPKSDNHLDRVNYLLAAGCAIQNMQLKAYESGLGTCCCTAAVWVKDQLAQLLALDGREVVSLILVGYPDEEPAAPPRDYEVVDWLEV